MATHFSREADRKTRKWVLFKKTGSPNGHPTFLIIGRPCLVSCRHCLSPRGINGFGSRNDRSKHLRPCAIESIDVLVNAISTVWITRNRFLWYEALDKANVALRSFESELSANATNPNGRLIAKLQPTSMPDRPSTPSGNRSRRRCSDADTDGTTHLSEKKPRRLRKSCRRAVVLE